MACNFLDTSSGAPPVEDQVVTYCLSLVPTGMCNKMVGEILFILTEHDASIFRTDVCSGFTLISDIGNQLTYVYEGLQIVLYKI